MKILTLLLALLLASPAFADSCDSMTPFGKPVVTTAETVTRLCRKMYVIEHSPSKHSALWSAEHLVAKDMSFDEPRVDAFKADPDLPDSETAKPSDYAGTGWDKGHQSPVGDMHADKDAMLESFYMSNMFPQHPKNNRIGWKAIETFVRELAVSRGELYVITGPVYKGVPKTIGKTRVAIPTLLYKIVYDPNTHAAMTFLTLNAPFYQKDIPSALSTVEAVEIMTGINFFPTATTPITNATTLWTAHSN